MSPSEEEKFYTMGVKIRKLEERISIILGNLEDERCENEELRKKVRDLEEKLNKTT